MISSQYKGILFDLTNLPDADRTPDLCRGWVEGRQTNYIALGYNTFVGEIVDNYFHDKPQFEKPENVIHCGLDDWYQYLLIKHLPWEVIVDYFSNRNA